MNRLAQLSMAAHCCANGFVMLWRDDQGFIVTIELILIVTILVIGLIAGLTALRDAVVSELTDVARAIQESNQSFSLNGIIGHSGTTVGSGFSDHTDVPVSPNGADQCIVVFGTADEF